MLYIIDLKTDESDDLVLENGNISLEDDEYISTIKTGERRVSARGDDFILDDIGAGLEKYMYQNLENSKSGIVFDVSKSLRAGGLFSDSDFEVITLASENKVAQVFIKINSGLTKSQGFRVIIDQLNQNSYR